MYKITESERVFICPTDTVYGISSRANDKDAIERIRELKGRDDSRFIILISNLEQLKDFDISLTQRQIDFLNKIWPGTVTVAFDDVHAFRLPNSTELTDLIDEIGPIVSTSANLSGESVVKNIDDAKEIFGESVDKYIDGGELSAEPSTIIKLIR